MKGRACQENLLDVSCMVTFSESVLSFVPQGEVPQGEEAYEEVAENVPEVVPEVVPELIATPNVIQSPEVPSVQSYRSETGISYGTVEMSALYPQPSQSSFLPIQPVGEQLVIPMEPEEPEVEAVPVQLAESVVPSVPELPSTLPSVSTLPPVNTLPLNTLPPVRTVTSMNTMNRTSPTIKQITPTPLPPVQSGMKPSQPQVQPIIIPTPIAAANPSPQPTPNPVIVSSARPIPHPIQTTPITVSPQPAVISAAQQTSNSTHQQTPTSPVVQVIPSVNTQEHPSVLLTGPAGSPLPKVLPSCFTIDAVTDDIFRDGEYIRDD